MKATFRTAEPRDEQAIRELLERVELPVSDYSLDKCTAVVAELDAAIAGHAAIEVYDDIALLRSVAVDPANRDLGIARMLVDEIHTRARQLGVQQMYLLTETAEGYFQKRGFVRLERKSAPESIRTSSEFSQVCSETAVLMVTDLLK